MGAKVEIPKIVGDELIKRFGRRLRIVSEKDFRMLLRVATKASVCDWVDSEKVTIRGWKGK